MALVLSGVLSGGPLAAEGTTAFTVSMPRPAAHLFHVTMRCGDLKGELQDFLMAAWMPGFYRILEYEKNVSGFRAADGTGRALPWEKVTKNTWRVATGGARTAVLDYDVLGNILFVAQNYLDEKRAFIAPPGLYMYPAAQLRHPVTVTFEMPPGWAQVGTGLDPVKGRPRTYAAPDFDILYDCPALLGNQEVRSFEVRGIPHTVVIEDVPESVDRTKMVADLKRLVEAATGLMGDIPYQHYTFLLMGNGRGGIEHANSAACAFDGKGLTEEKGYRGWLSYISHEYFHLFNVKRIRPIALGPFDYETENLTDMLWVSEGLTVYYENIVMVRAGLMTPAQYLEEMQNAMTRFENTPGRRYMSAAESSLETWGGAGFGGDRRTTMSYYDNGAMLGAMLDIGIRAGSRNARSLDDVMRSLYRKYYGRGKRGFTDAEFRAECESAAGRPLADVLEYAWSSRDVDYAKHFAPAGLEVKASTAEAPGAFLGLDTRRDGGRLFVTGTTAGSPAEAAGLKAGDEIMAVDDQPASTKALSDRLSAKKPGEKLEVRYARGGHQAGDVEITLAKNTKVAYTIARAANPDSLQAAILKDWLRTGR
ncbi:MAG TPA: PDZ domain-containing protein [Terriglobales bacterium]|nr:PDZ domain-containing protein [Terriglobales bacterium]